MKKIFTLFLTLFLASSVWAYVISVDGISYSILNETEVAVSRRTNSGYSGDIIIPSSITYKENNYSVTSIGEDAFYGCTGLTSITMPNSVTTIESYAFDGCSKLTSITIPNSVTTIESYAFRRCTKLTSITISNSVTYIESNILYGCDNISSITVDSGNEKFDSRNNCNAIIETATNTLILGCKKSFIPSSVTSIGEYAFYCCTGLTTIIMPHSVTSIGEYAFYCCTGLTSIRISNSVTSIGEDAFDGCTGLTSIAIPESVTSIGKHAFSSCYSLKNVTIHNGVDSIGERAFSICTGLTSIAIPESVTSIGKDAFDGCTSLTSITMPESLDASSAELCFKKDGIRYRVLNGKEVQVKENRQSSYDEIECYEDIVIPNIVTAGNTFSVTSMGDNVFKGCEVLSSITIPNSVTSIGKDAFDGCTSLTSITMPESLDASSASLYIKKEGIRYQILNGREVSVAGVYFDGIINPQNSDYEALKKLNIPSSITAGNTFSVTSIRKNAFSRCVNLSYVTLPEGLSSIGSSAFSDCSKLYTLTIPESVTTIASSAFHSNTKLSYLKNGILYKILNENDVQVLWNNYSGDIVIPNEVTLAGKTYSVVSLGNAGDGAFTGCTNLNSITIPNSITSLNDKAFYNCSGLTSVTIPNSVTSIGERAFENCTNLTSITIPNSITSLNDKAFYNCSGLTSVIIPNSVTSIEYEAFAGCKSLTSITLSDGVTSIDVAAFGNCTSLTSITIPNSVTTIKSNAFSNCTSLTSITFEGLISSCASNALASPTSIYVPCEYVEEYKNLLPGYVDLIVTKTPLINENKNCMIKFIPNCPDFIIEAVPNKGYKFVSWSDGNTDIERIVAVDSTVYEAIVEPCVVTATADSLEQGSVSVSYRKEGNYYVLTAMPNEGYHFVKWTDGSTANPRTVYPKNDESYVAVFEHDKPITPEVSISKLSNATAVTIVNGQILVNGEAPAFVVTVAGQKIANANLKAGVYFVVIDGETVGVSVR